MKLDAALKAFRRINYKYGEAATGVIVCGNASELSNIMAQSVTLMQGGTAPVEFDHTRHRIEVLGAGNLRFRTGYDVFNGLVSGESFAFIGCTKFALIECGIRLEHMLVPQLRSRDVPEQDRKFVTIEG